MNGELSPIGLGMFLLRGRQLRPSQRRECLALLGAQPEDSPVALLTSALYSRSLEEQNRKDAELKVYAAALASVEEALPELERLETAGQELARKEERLASLEKGLEEYLLELSRSQQSAEELRAEVARRARENEKLYHWAERQLAAREALEKRSARLEEGYEQRRIENERLKAINAELSGGLETARELLLHVSGELSAQQLALRQFYQAFDAILEWFNPEEHP